MKISSLALFLAFAVNYSWADGDFWEAANPDNHINHLYFDGGDWDRFDGTVCCSERCDACGRCHKEDRSDNPCCHVSILRYRFIEKMVCCVGHYVVTVTHYITCIKLLLLRNDVCVASPNVLITAVVHVF